MIECLIFSKDRAMQVNATLQSLFLHCSDIQNMHITVLYKCSAERHERQYQELSQTWRNQVTFVKQSHFRRDVVKILNPFQKGSLSYLLSLAITFLPARVIRFITKYRPLVSEAGLVLFLVDDAIFTGDFSLSQVEDGLKNNPDAVGFSLRLGKNINYCYMMDRAQPQPEFSTLSIGILKFDWTKSKLDFAYPLEVSSSLYRLNEIFPLLLRVNFFNPNYLEGGLVRFVDQFRNPQPNLLCFERSVAFCNPINLVQTVSLENRVAQKSKTTADDLALMFDEGVMIDIDAYNGFIPSSCHQEMDLVFTKREPK